MSLVLCFYGSSCHLTPKKQILWYATENKASASYDGNIVNSVIIQDSKRYFELLSRYFIGNQCLFLIFF